MFCVSLTSLLAQAPDPAPVPGLSLPDEPGAYTVLLWAGLIIAAAILMGMLSLAIRKRLLKPDEPDAGGVMGFTLADLRQMHAEGQMTDAEFTQAKRRLIANARAEFADDEEDADDHEVHLESESDRAGEGFAGDGDDDEEDPDAPF